MGQLDLLPIGAVIPPARILGCGVHRGSLLTRFVASINL
jgi:hypothetical protein